MYVLKPSLLHSSKGYAPHVLTLRPPPADTQRVCGDDDDMASPNPPGAEAVRGVVQKPARRMACAAPPEKEEDARAAIPVVGTLQRRTAWVRGRGRQSGGEAAVYVN